MLRSTVWLNTYLHALIIRRMALTAGLHALLLAVVLQLTNRQKISQLRSAAYDVADLNRFAIFRLWCHVGRHLATGC
jgi:hypothetical protein